MATALWYAQEGSKQRESLADWTARATRKRGRPKKTEGPRQVMKGEKTMADVKTLTVQKTVTDLSTIEEVTLVKEFTVAPVSSTEEALSRLGNDNAKLLAVINDGLEAEERRKAREENSGWHVMTDEGEKGEAFAGQVADPKVVNGLVLTMAKTVFGYSKDLDAAAKKAAKENAMSFIKDTPKIREGLAKSAAQAAAAAE